VARKRSHLEGLERRATVRIAGRACADAQQVLTGSEAAIFRNYYYKNSIQPMKCPFCQHGDTQVLDTRVSEKGMPSGAGAAAANATSVSRPTSAH
jgi:hypothetical protein